MSKRKTKSKSKMFKVATTMADGRFIVPANFAEDLLHYVDSRVVEINAMRARLLREEQALIKQHIETINDLLRSYGDESTGRR